VWARSVRCFFGRHWNKWIYRCRSENRNATVRLFNGVRQSGVIVTCSWPRGILRIFLPLPLPSKLPECRTLPRFADRMQSQVRLGSEAFSPGDGGGRSPFSSSFVLLAAITELIIAGSRGVSLRPWHKDVSFIDRDSWQNSSTSAFFFSQSHSTAFAGLLRSLLDLPC